MPAAGELVGLSGFRVARVKEYHAGLLVCAPGSECKLSPAQAAAALAAASAAAKEESGAGAGAAATSAKAAGSDSDAKDASSAASGDSKSEHKSDSAAASAPAAAVGRPLFAIGATCASKHPEDLHGFGPSLLLFRCPNPLASPRSLSLAVFVNVQWTCTF